MDKVIGQEMIQLLVVLYSKIFIAHVAISNQGRRSHGGQVEGQHGGKVEGQHGGKSLPFLQELNFKARVLLT